MTRLRACVVSPFVVVAVGGLLAALTFDRAEPTRLYVNQLASEPSRWAGETILVQGIVQTGSQQRTDAAGDWRFTVTSRGAVLPVHYAGVMPSTFTDGAEVLVLGELSDRQFSARNVLVRVPD